MRHTDSPIPSGSAVCMDFDTTQCSLCRNDTTRTTVQIIRGKSRDPLHGATSNALTQYPRIYSAVVPDLCCYPDSHSPHLDCQSTHLLIVTLETDEQHITITIFWIIIYSVDSYPLWIPNGRQFLCGDIRYIATELKRLSRGLTYTQSITGIVSIIFLSFTLK